MCKKLLHNCSDFNNLPNFSKIVVNKASKIIDFVWNPQKQFLVLQKKNYSNDFDTIRVENVLFRSYGSPTFKKLLMYKKGVEAVEGPGLEF